MKKKPTKPRFAKPKPPRPGKLTERQAWELLDHIFSRRAGLCFAIQELEAMGAIRPETADDMTKRVKQERKRLDSIAMYLWPIPHGSGDENRREFIRRQINEIDGKAS